jgi:hypothetical protein
MQFYCILVFMQYILSVVSFVAICCNCHSQSRDDKALQKFYDS